MTVKMIAVELTPAELTSRSKELSRTLDELDQLEEEKREFQKHYKETREDLEAKVRGLARTVRTGIEERPYDPQRNLFGGDAASGHDGSRGGAEAGLASITLNMADGSQVSGTPAQVREAIDTVKGRKRKPNPPTKEEREKAERERLERDGDAILRNAGHGELAKGGARKKRAEDA